jgi:putative transcriptional regulator
MDLRLLTDRICGDIVFSDNPGKAMRKWRLIFDVNQSELASRLGISQSVISDYEGERRKSPGIVFVKRFIDALIDIDKERGYRTISQYRYIMGMDTDVVIDIAEYSRSVSSREFCKKINGEAVNNFEKVVNGHTIVDSIKAILSLNAFDFYRLYGLSSERALVFTKVSTGRSPMVAVRVSNLKPSVVVLHGIEAEKVDEIARKIAEIERIPLITTLMNVDDVVNVLRRSFV